jgi:hypothetical protein
VFAFVVVLQFRAFQFEIGLLGICLRVDRHIFPRRHGDGSGYQAGNSREHYAVVSGMRRRHTQYQASRRKDPVVGAQYRRSQPANAPAAVPFLLVSAH